MGARGRSVEVGGSGASKGEERGREGGGVVMAERVEEGLA